MRFLPFGAAGAVALAGLTVLGATTSPVHAAPADTAYALSGTTLLRFDTADPTKVVPTPITGTTTAETLVGLDARPHNGQLYTLGVNPTTDTATLYVLHEQTGYAAVVGTAGSIALTTDGATPVALPDPTTAGYGFDFDPTQDRIRVTQGTLSFRVNPNTGAPIDGNNGGGVEAGTNPDAPVSGATTSVDGSAYTSTLPDSGNVTSLYTLDSASNSLYLQNQTPATSGGQSLVHALMTGGSALDFSAVRGFDIPTGVAAATNGAAVTSGVGYAALTVGGSTKLYTVDLVSGAATLVGAVGTGLYPVKGLALQRDIDEGYPAIGLNTTGTALLRFSTTAPGQATTQPISNLAAGETLAAVAWRPQTGQLMGLGVDAAADAGTLYRIDPQSGVLTPIGATGGVQWVRVSDEVTPVDLPDPATTGYAMDVNSVPGSLKGDPASDVVRVIAGPDFNARISPVSGNPVDGTSFDVPINADAGVGVGIAAFAYTGGYGRDLSVPGPTPTMYALEPALNVLLTSVGGGPLAEPRTVTAGGTLDIPGFAGLDIPEDVTGTAYAAIASGLYTSELATGKATNLGSLPVGLRSLTLGQAGANRAVPPPPAAAVPAKLTKTGAPKQQKKTVKTGRTLSCPTAFSAAVCTTTLKVTASYKVKVKGKTKTRKAVVGKATVKTARGKSTALKVSLSKSGVKLLKQRK